MGVLLLADNTSKLLLADNTSKLLLMDTPGALYPNPFTNDSSFYTQTVDLQYIPPEYVGSVKDAWIGTGDRTISLTGLTGGLSSAPQEGDIVVIAYGIGTATVDVDVAVTTSGYTEVADLYPGGSWSANLGVFYKVMGSTPDTSVVLTSTGASTRQASAVIHVWRYIYSANPIDVYTTTTSTAVSGIIDPPDITPTAPGAIILGIGATSASTSNTIIQGRSLSNFVYAQLEDTGLGSDTECDTGIGYTRWVSGTYAPPQWVGGGGVSGDSMSAVSLALRPMGGTAPAVTASSVRAWSWSSDNSAATTTVSQYVPDTQDGDVLLWAIATDIGTATPFTWPAGWTSLGSTTSSVNAGSFDIAYRTASSEPSLYSVTLSSSDFFSSTMIAVRDTTGYDSSAFTGAVSTNNTTLPSLTTTTAANNELSLYFAAPDMVTAWTGTNNFPTYTFPSGYTQNISVSDSDSAAIGVAKKTRSTAGSEASGTGTASATGGQMAAVVNFSPPASTTQTLTPSLYTNTNTFYSPTITQGGSTQTLVPDLYVNSNTFYSAIVTVGSVTLTPSLYTNSNSFYSPTVAAGAITLTPSLYVNSNIFYSPTVTVGAVTLTPSLYTNPNTFYSPTVAAGAVTLTPSLYTNTNTFYSPTVAAGAVTLTPSRYVNSNAFYSPTVAAGAVTLSPGLFSNTNSFYGPTVIAGSGNLYPSLYTNTNTFYSATVTGGASTDTGAFFLFF